MNTTEDVRPRVSVRGRKSLSVDAEAAAPVAKQPRLPRLNPIFATLKALVSERTLPAFQFAQRSAATYLKVNVEFDVLDTIDDPIAFHLLVHDHEENVSVTVDYRDGEDLASFAQRAKSEVLALLLKELAVAAKILRSDLSEYVTPLLDGFDALKKDLNGDPKRAIDAFWGEGLRHRHPWGRFHEQYGRPYWEKLGVLEHLTGGFATLRHNGLLEPFMNAAAPKQGYAYPGYTLDATLLLLEIGYPLSRLLSDIQRLPDWIPEPMTDAISVRAENLDDLLRTLEPQVSHDQRRENEELFQARATRLIELTGDEHLKFSLEQGFPSRATYYQLLLDTLARRIVAKVIAPLVESGILPSEDHVRVRILDEYSGPAYTQGNGIESRSPSLAALKIYANVREFLKSDEVAHGFGVGPEPIPAIIYDPDDNSDDWDDEDDRVTRKNREIIVVPDMFSGPLNPRENQLYIYVGKQLSAATSDETSGGSR